MGEEGRSNWAIQRDEVDLKIADSKVGGKSYCFKLQSTIMHDGFKQELGKEKDRLNRKIIEPKSICEIADSTFLEDELQVSNLRLFFVHITL